MDLLFSQNPEQTVMLAKCIIILLLKSGCFINCSVLAPYSSVFYFMTIQTLVIPCPFLKNPASVKAAMFSTTRHSVIN